MHDITAAFLSGMEAGRFQGWEDGRQTGYRDGWNDGQLDGGIRAWRAAEADERARAAPYTPGGPPYSELERIRNDPATHPSKPLKTPAECLATWSTP